MKTTIQDDKGFTAKLTGFTASSKHQRAALQDLLVYGLEKYKDHTDTSALSKVINTLVGVRTIPSKTVKEYIQDHANVVLKKTKDGSFVFKKHGETAVVTMPEAVWWEHESNDKNTAKVDVIDPVALVRALAKKLMDAKESGKVVAGREDVADDMLARIREFCNMEPATKETLKAQAGLTA